MKLDQIPDNGYVFIEELEQHERAAERLRWAMLGFSLCINLTKRQRDVVYRVVELRQTQEKIAMDMGISQQRVSRIWINIAKKCKKKKIMGLLNHL